MVMKVVMAPLLFLVLLMRFRAVRLLVRAGRQLVVECGELMARSLLAPFGLLMPVEVRRVLGQHQRGAVSVGLEQDGGERDRDRGVVDRQGGRVDDPVV